MQNVFFAADFHGMTGIAAALEADDRIHIAGQNVDQFAFAFVTPLGSDQNVCTHFLNSCILIY
jgi:hypothetical protein